MSTWSSPVGLALGAAPFAGARVVVTGSSGFIGSHLVAALAHQGASVIGLDRNPPRRWAPGEHRTVDLAAADDLDVVADVLGDADAVFHLAGRGGVRERGPVAALDHHRDNIVTATAVLRATPARTPVLVTSSSSVYGGARWVGSRIRPSREGDGLEPASEYARAKIRVEQLCARRRARGGVVVVTRPFTVVGPGQRADMAISRWIDAVLSGQPIQIFGSPEVQRDMTDVAGVVAAFIELLARPSVELVNVGTGTMVRLGEVVAEVVKMLRRGPLHAPSVEIIDAPCEDPGATRADTRRLSGALGWVPTTEITDIVGRQVAALFETASDEVDPPESTMSRT